MLEKVEQYLKEHSEAWAASTLRVESRRLRRLAEHLEQGPAALETYLQEQGNAPYSIKTALIRIAHFEKWLGQDLGYSRHLKFKARKYKHVYQRREVNLTAEKVNQAIARIPADSRPTVEFMLLTGLRISEVYAVQQDAQGLFVVGKGGKPRRIYGTKELPEFSSLHKVRRALAKVGLRPHDLRKIAATRLAVAGLEPHNLCKVFGWSSIATAYYYLQTDKDETLHEVVHQTATKSRER